MEEIKKPCAPVEEECRDYNELGLFLHSREKNQTLKAAQMLWEFLPAWMAARKMAIADRNYNKVLSGVIAENAAVVLKAAQEMAEWESEESEQSEMH